MMYLQNLIEPRRLLLLWQQLDLSTRRASGDRYIVGEIRQHDEGRVSLHYYDDAETQKAKSLGFAGLTAFPLSESLHFDDVAEVLAKRLPPASRSDYADYLRSYRLPPERAGEFSLMQLLAYTGGMLAGDGFSFAFALDEVTPPFDLTFTIAGFRHNQGMALSPLTQLLGQAVQLKPDPTNQHDPRAIAVLWGEVLLGYVPRGLTTALLERVIHQAENEATICRINGTKTNPNVMVMVRVTK